jgi:DNA polymerase-3 subunit delta
VNALKNELKQDEIKPIYVISGAEELLKREAVALIVEAALVGGTKELNLTNMLWKEVSVEQIVHACCAIPMLGLRSVIVVRYIDSISSEQSAHLAAYLEDPSPHAVLVFLCSGNADMRLKFFKKAKAVGSVKSFKTLYANQLPSWVSQRMCEQHCTIDGDAASLLADTVGADLAALNEAIERLILFVAGDDGTGNVSLADVEQCIARTRVYSVFELTDALGRRRTGDALQILIGMLNNREEPIRIVAMIARHFRRLLHAGDAVSQGESKEAVGKGLNVHRYFLEDFLRQASLFSSADYAALFQRLFVTDRALKSSRVDPQLHLHNLVLGICADLDPKFTTDGEFEVDETAFN